MPGGIDHAVGCGTKGIAERIREEQEEDHESSSTRENVCRRLRGRPANASILIVMADDPILPPEKSGSVDWADLRAQAEKLGITLSELQQRQREQKARLDRKNQFRPRINKADS
jgi:hypothetical protein